MNAKITLKQFTRGVSAKYYKATDEKSKIYLSHLIGEGEFYEGMLDSVKILAELHNIDIFLLKE